MAKLLPSLMPIKYHHPKTRPFISCKLTHRYCRTVIVCIIITFCFLSWHKMRQTNANDLSCHFYRRSIFYKLVLLPKVFRSSMLFQLIKRIQQMKHRSRCQLFCQPIQLPHHQAAPVRNKLPPKLPLYRLRKQTNFQMENHILLLLTVSTVCSIHIE